jgi:eukaryotic translation initiation factor 2C
MDSKSIVVASACLDVHSMRIAHDVRLCSRCNDSIYEDVLVYLTTSILAQYYSVNKVVPKRMLIYREGVSEGTFDHVAGHEIDSIRKGYHRFTTEVLGSESNCSCTAGCNLCCPLITFVACMLNTNIKIVPEFPQTDGVCRDKYGKGVFNVPSGSCIDDVIVDGPPANVYGEIHTQRMQLNNPNKITCFSEPGSNGFDFILVAHGSGLGTSKPVHYRVLLNENVVLKAGENCTPLTRETLENLTNQMSYQYSTATKAIRMVPVIYYGSRLATMTIKYLNYLESQSELDKLEIDMSRLLPPENRQGDGESNGDSNRSQRRRFGVRRDNQDDARFIFTRKGVGILIELLFHFDFITNTQLKQRLFRH